ncbi:arsenic transporter [Actinoplanes italicus]|uniref:Arsenite efflux membrane protein ArsB n=2 Tax=Actinoplanes italicus TaxID=113567 RepID=A0A2T0K9I4_9ACTN|nr:ArsB/NhaD family transporter [Actinoplanes italicus]PRX19774.1 arsenite efflux membrane protein ArsB [Actinoplanes italicus]GIE31625.1 arsenic transporter [Actinoplanes italicus]
MIIALILLGAVLGFAVVRPRGLPEATAAVPAALLAVASGLVTPAGAVGEIRELAPTVAFLAAILVLAFTAERHGVFGYLGALVARSGRGRPRRLLGAVFGAAAVTTAVLSLDATVVLLTPVVFAVAARAGVGHRPHSYACNHLANSASLLLPVSNLTNLLAFTASGLTFAGFAALMAAPWLAVILVEFLIFQFFFATDLARPGDATDLARLGNTAADGPTVAPRYALAVLAVTLAGFAGLQPFGVEPAWVAGLGAIALAVPLLKNREIRPGELIARADPAFCAFVLSLGVVVLAVRVNGLGDHIETLLPQHADLLGLLGAAVLAAVLANLLNNLPATLVLLPAVADSPGLLLAVLIGVNVGPNLTYAGSLATLLWRRILHARDAAPRTSEFLKLGAVTVPLSLLAGVTALWAGLHLA